ncbi:TetR/AcrR family transcriptional regulator [Streptomyces shenzhenensis]|uniref:TetR/AcrR family transcriptional regulator n=2 Tax=Streptomyces shenzhenensis TaxID=943815 RepID=UPI003687267D
MGTEQPLGLRERTRRAVRREITETAERLFIERGYDATTIEDIAAAIGMSPRSVFRYFPTKEDLLVGKFDTFTDSLAEALSARPGDEPAWTSLRRSFEVLVPQYEDADTAAMAKRIQEVVFSTPALHARYLQKLQALQDAAVDTLRARSEGASPAPGAPGLATLELAAVVGAAFACLLAAQRAWLAGDGARPIASLLDDAMAALTPRI